MSLALILLSMMTASTRFVPVDKGDPNRDYRECWLPCLLFCRPMCPEHQDTTILPIITQTAVRHLQIT